MVYFIAGTDTDSGKTLVASSLLHLASKQGTTLGVKPIASGCEQTPAGLRNSDALALMAESNLSLDYDSVNPFAFAPAIAPHIAAKQVGISLNADLVSAHLKTLPLDELDFALVEGAGGWRLPLNSALRVVGQLNEQAFLSTVVRVLQLPVILVVGVKLGCLNHALLTQEAIQADGVKIAGWVANCVDPEMEVTQDNLSALTELMDAPCLGVIPHLSECSSQTAAKYLDLDKLAPSKL
nr:dethiobiotin synthase [Shewanella sp. Isolate7]